MGEFIKSYGTLILAIYGIIQVWGIELYKKYLCKGKIDIYETGTIEIGYSTFGPTISLNGTLRARDKDVFIRSIDLLVIREKDKAQHVFKWVAFRSPKIDLAGTKPISMEIPSGFLVSPDLPHRFNIVFNDNELFENIRSLYNKYNSKCYEVLKQMNNSPVINNKNKLIEDFEKSEIHRETYDAFYTKYYWEAGEYSLAINVKVSKPDSIFTNNYYFSISEDDSKKVRLNVVTMLKEPITNQLKIENFPYNFAYVAYKDYKKTNVR